jgi:hypothetical protein
VIPRADTGRADEREDEENDYEYPKKVHGDSYDKNLPRPRLCADRLKSTHSIGHHHDLFHRPNVIVDTALANSKGYFASCSPKARPSSRFASSIGG